MNSTENALHELRRQIEANKALLEEQERALMVLETMMGYSTMPVNGVRPLLASNASVQNGMIAVEDLDNEADGARRTLRTEVTDVINRLGDQEFSIAHIDAALKKMGVVVNGNYPRSRISTILAKLENEGILIKTFGGSGNVPHKYKLKLTENMF
jgi:hypothetical protein